MNAPESLKDAIRRLIDSKMGGKVVAEQAGVNRTTLYNIMRTGKASDMTIRKLQEKFSSSTTSTTQQATTR